MEDLKNKISINVRYYKGHEIKRIAGHNSRKDEITYLLEEEDKLGQNIDLFYNDGKAKAFGSETDAQEKEKMFNDIFEKLEAKKNSIQRAKKSYSKKSENLLLEGVFAFPRELTKEYLKNGKRNNIIEGLNKFTQNIKKQYGFEPMQISLHLDEGYRDEESGEILHNIHGHLTFMNFNFEKGVMPLRGMKKSDWSNWQDIAAQSMQEAGLDFQRGDSKDITNRRHLGRNDFIEATKIVKSELSNVQKQVENWEWMRDEVIADCLAEEKRLTNLRDELLETNKKNEKGTEIYQGIYKKIGETKKELKEVRNIRKEFKAIEDKEQMIKMIYKTIDRFIDNNVVTSTNLVGSKTHKIEDIDSFVKKLKVIAYNINRVEFEEINGLKKTIEQKDKEIETLKVEHKKEIVQKDQELGDVKTKLKDTLISYKVVEKTAGDYKAGKEFSDRKYKDLVDNLTKLSEKELLEYTRKLAIENEVIEFAEEQELEFEDITR